jgi:hypothetical protein
VEEKKMRLPPSEVSTKGISNRRALLQNGEEGAILQYAGWPTMWRGEDIMIRTDDGRKVRGPFLKYSGFVKGKNKTGENDGT